MKLIEKLQKQWNKDYTFSRIDLKLQVTKWPHALHLTSSSSSSSGLLWGWRRKGVHLQGAQVHPAVWDLPEAPEALLRQVRSGEREDHPGLEQGGSPSVCECLGLTVTRASLTLVQNSRVAFRNTCEFKVLIFSFHTSFLPHSLKETGASERGLFRQTALEKLF